ncbi:HsdR family type I site-specific deoxyribonuclease [Streptomyces sp. ME02-6987-2C]|uniref:type I restriction endonuclease subunit R n=1 Tax=unclassified Streptomyces TaxID=2593676 RepID=UPI0029B9BD67|nr:MULTISPECIES: HsdR family type I site-specific deoxyribonuclease [unclassified Streptomyces]MDX3365017.1 HsdR family type I site-specific deoxyribonuclease [Streptomyces sp. ME02-6987-2C]MDX3420782.1 HsdR family type I site-specific deoxyribonuclease [Streptomyces sp. ME02-6985-2c]
MAKGIREREFQNLMIQWSLPMGWGFTAGRSLPRETTQTVVAGQLRDAIVRLNPGVINGFDVDAVVGEIVATVNAVDGGLVQANEQVLRLLRGHKEFRDTDGVWHALKVIDFESPTANTLVVSDELTITVPGKTSRRFDLVYWVNGLPLVVVEVKSPTAKSGWADAAREINDVYATEYPWFFTPNVFAVASDGLKLRFGSAGAPTNLWQPFRSTADDENLAGQADVQRSVELLMNPATILDMLANFALFDTAGGGVDRKYLPRYPQMEAAHLIHERVLAGGSKGLIWHHQGSGKTLLMVFAASLLLADTRAESPTIILLSDRTHLVRQTSGVFTSAMGDAYFHEPATSAELRTLLVDDVRGVISTTVHKFAGAGKNLSTRGNIIVLVDEAHRTQSAREKSLAGQMRAALPNAKFFGMTGTPVRNLATDTFALFGEESDPGRVLHRYSVSRSLLDEATVPVLLDPHPVAFEMNDRELQAEFDQFADDFDLEDPDRELLSRKFGRLTSVFSNPERIHAVCQDIVDHYLAGAYRNGLKAQVVAYNRELAVAYTDKVNELLAGFEASRVLAEVGKHDRITAEVNISVSDSKDEDPAMRKFQLSEAEEEEQKRRFLTADDPLCFLVVTAKLMTGFDAPNEGVLYLDKPLKAHSLFQTITRPNRTWVSPTGFVKTQGVVVDYIGLAEEVQRAVTDPTTKGAGKGGGFVTDLSELVAEFRTGFARVEDLFVDVDGLDLTVHGYESVRAINVFLDANPGAAEVFSKDYRLLARLYPLISTDKRIAKYRDGLGLFGSVYTTLFKKSSDEERKERLAELGPMVLEIINAHVHSFSVVASQEEALVLDAQGIAILKELLALVRPKPDTDDGEDETPPSAAEILDRIKAALDKGIEPGSVKYTALAERIKQLRDRIIQNAQDALEFLSEALRVARAIVDAEKHPDEAVVLDDDHVGILSRIILDHAPAGLTVTERNLAEEIDQVVTQTLARSWDNADARNRGVRRATAAVFRRYMLKPVGEPYDSTVAYIEAHYLVD